MSHFTPIVTPEAKKLRKLVESDQPEPITIDVEPEEIIGQQFGARSLDPRGDISPGEVTRRGTRPQQRAPVEVPPARSFGDIFDLRDQPTTIEGFREGGPVGAAAAFGKGFLGTVGAIGEALQSRFIEPGAGVVTAGVQSLIPGEQEIERKTREGRERGEGPIESARKAFVTSDLPTTRINIGETVAGVLGAPPELAKLLGDRVAFPIPFTDLELQEVDVGVKGLIELAPTLPFDVATLNVGRIAQVAKFTGKAFAPRQVASTLRRVLADETGAIRPNADMSTIGGVDREIARLARNVRRKQGKPDDAEDLQFLKEYREGLLATHLPEEKFAQHAEFRGLLDNAERELEGLRDSSRGGLAANKAPPFGTPERSLYDDARKAAREAGKPPVRQAVLVRRAQDKVQQLRGELEEIERLADEAAPPPSAARAAAPEPQQIGQGQAGFGIGERPQQGQLLGEFRDEGGVLPLIDQEQVAARQGARSAREAGQGDLIAPETPPTAPVEPRAPQPVGEAGGGVPITPDTPPAGVTPPPQPPPAGPTPPVSGGVPPASGPVPEGRFAAPLRDLEEIAGEVVTSSNPFVRALAGRTGINPSVLQNSDIGRRLVAYQRQQVASSELTDVALAGALDVHAERFTTRLGKVLDFDKDGFVAGTGKRWEDVFSRPDDFDLSPATRAYIDDYLAVIDDVEALRVQAGLKPRAKQGPEGWFYVPRQVTSIRGVELRRPSNPNLQRIYEEATEGYGQKGANINYSNNPRENLRLHVRAAYREIANAQLSDAVTPYSIRPLQLVPEPVRIAHEKAARRYIKARAAVNRLKVPRVSVTKPAAKRAGQARRTKEQMDVARAEKLTRAEAQKGMAAAKAELEAATDPYLAARRKASRALESARRAEVAKGGLFGGAADETIPITMWRNRFFKREDGDRLREGLEALGAPGIPTRVFETVGNNIRFLASVGDFAVQMIQGLPVLAVNPRAWGRATLRGFQAFADPTVQARLVRERIGTYQKMARHGVPVGDPEFFAALAPGRNLSVGELLEFLPQGAEARRFLQMAGKQTFGRFQASYNTFLGSVRALLWEAMEDSWSGSLDELGAFIRNLTGGLDSRALGLAAPQRAAEGMWLAFSPRLLRSTVALVSDAVAGLRVLRPGATVSAKQVASLQAISKLVSGTIGIYVSTGLALGKDWEEIGRGLNPLEGKRFLSHQVNGDWIGVGGQIRALLQFLTKTISTLAPGGEPIENFLSADQFENPVIGLYMSRGAPAINIAGGFVEAATGGRIDVLPFDRIDSFADLPKHLATSALPFAVQGVLEGENAVTTALALFGARTSAETPGEARGRLRQTEMERRGIPGDFEDLDGDVRRSIDETSAVQGAQERVAEGGRERGSEYQAYKDERQEIDDRYDGLVEQAAEELGTGRAFREIYGDHQSNRALEKERLLGRSQEALAFLDDLDPRTAQFDLALDAYFEAVGDDELENEATGEYDFNRRDENIQRLVVDRFGQGMLDRLTAFFREHDSPLVKQLKEDRDLLSQYWDASPRLAVPESQAIWEEYQAASRFDQSQLRAQYGSFITELVNARDEMRMALRQQNPEIDAALIRWEYGPTRPVTEEGAIEFRRKIGQQDASAGEVIEVEASLEELGINEQEAASVRTG